MRINRSSFNSNSIRFTLLAGATLCLTLLGCSSDSLSLQRAKIEVSIKDNSNYASFDVDTLTIDLGEVPVYGSKTATFHVSNRSVTPLRITAINFSEAEGTLWEAPTWRRNDSDTTGKVPPVTIRGEETRLIDVTFSPIQTGEASATALISHDGGPDTVVKVVASAVYVGDPEIEVSYNGLLVPNEAEDCTDGVCALGESSALNLGNIALDGNGTTQVIVKNVAECDPDPGGNPCSTCVLRIGPDSEHHNLGIGFKEGTNTDGRFSIETTFSFPTELPQKDAECGNTGEAKVLVKFNAPSEESEHQAVLVIESNDATEGIIEIPVKARALNAPIAVATLREFDVSNPSAPSTDPDDIEPLFRVHLDGRQSYDPSLPAPGNTNLPFYHWEVVNSPQEFAETEYQWIGQDQSTSSLWVPIAGEYTIKLTVQNEDGIPSGNTETAFVTFTAIPGSAIHIQLVWDHPSNDQDLHLVWGTNSGSYENICNKQHDCYFRSCKDTSGSNRVHWFPEQAAGTGPNPRLDRDDTNGLGPENINIDEPNPGKYRVYVHYWGGSYNGAAATVNTVRIYLNGLLRFDQHRTLTAISQIWGIGTIDWTDDGSELGTGNVEVFDGNEGQVGVVSTMNVMDCGDDAGWNFPAPHPQSPSP